MSDAVIPAYLGWGNPERDKVQMRLYATDEGSKDRWDTNYVGGKVVEYAAIERAATEGDRFLVVRVGNRFTPDEAMQRVAEAIFAALSDAPSESEALAEQLTGSEGTSHNDRPTDAPSERA